MLETFAIGVGLNLGSALLGSLFGGGNKQPWTQREINKLETFDQPQSRYGEPIPEFYGRVRVQGIYVAAQIPFDSERDEFRNGSTNEIELTYIYYGNLGVLWGIAPLQANINIQKIYFNKQVYVAGGQIDGTLGEYWGRFEGLSTADYSGGQTTPDPKLSFLGENHTAFRGSMYSAMSRLRLNNADGGLFDFRYPNLEAEIITHDQGASFTLADVVANLLEKAGYAPAEYDVSELESIECRGFISTVGRLSDKLGKLQSAYFFEIADTGAQLKFIKAFRPSSSAYIPATDLGTSDGDRLGELFTETEEDPASLPTSFRVYFNDYGNNYQPNSKESFKIKLGDWENVEEIETGLTLTESEAYTIANRLLLLAWTRRKTYKSFLPPKYQRLEGGDVVDVELRAGTATPLQIKRINQSPSGVLELEAIAYDGSIFGLGYTAPAAITSTATATQGTAINLGQTNVYAINSVTDITGTPYVLGTDYTVNTSTGTITPIIGGGISNGSGVVVNWQGEAEPAPAPSLTPITTSLAAIDIVKPTDSDFPGIYLFADGDAPWQSATLWVSEDGTNYNSAGPIYRGIFGTANTTLPDGSGEDLISTLTVTVTETMAFPASGRLLVGVEILDYASAVLDSSTTTSKTYTLSQFQRALRGTDGTGHGGGESVYLLSGYKFVSPIAAADVGTTRYFKAVSPGQGLGDVAAISIVIEGNSLGADNAINGDITYYVDPINGSDLNEGSQGSPFQTIEKGLEVAKDLDFNGHRCALQLADGIYDGELIFPTLATSDNDTLNRLFIQGNPTNHENVILTSTTGYGIVIRYEQRYVLKDLTIQNDTGSVAYPGLYCQFGGGCFLENVRFGDTTGDHIFVDHNSYASIVSNSSGGLIEETGGTYTIAGNCRYHIVQAGGGQFRCQNATVTVNSIAFTSFLFANSGAIGDFAGTTYTGTATGQKFIFGSGVSVSPPSGGYDSFPGDTPGVGLELSDPTAAIAAKFGKDNLLNWQFWL